jgi:hypothetical protein
MWVGGAAKDPVEEAEEKVEHAFSTLLERDPSFRACRRTLLTLDDGSIGEDGVLRPAYADAHASLWTTAS